MNMGPSGNASWLEIGFAVLFVILVFGVFIFAFATPIYTYFANHKDRWPDYTSEQKRKVVTKASVTIVVGAVLVYFATSSFS